MISHILLALIFIVDEICSLHNTQTFYVYHCIDPYVIFDCIMHQTYVYKCNDNSIPWRFIYNYIRLM